MAKEKIVGLWVSLVMPRRLERRNFGSNPGRPIFNKSKYGVSNMITKKEIIDYLEMLPGDPVIYVCGKPMRSYGSVSGKKSSEAVNFDR